MLPPPPGQNRCRCSCNPFPDRQFENREGPPRSESSGNEHRAEFVVVVWRGPFLMLQGTTRTWIICWEPEPPVEERARKD